MTNTIKPSQVCINRAEAIMINVNGKAQSTGYFALNYAKIGAETISIYKGKGSFKNGCYITDTIGAPVLQYPAKDAFPVDEFLKVTGWTPEA